MARHNASRGHRDQAGIGPHPGEAVNLVPLRELDGFKVADGEPDIRGWNVRTLAGREIGEVQDLLVDSNLGEVVMLDINLANSDRHTLAPIRAVQIDRTRRSIIVDSGDIGTADAELPSMRRGELSAEDAAAFGAGYERAYGDRGFDRDREINLRRGSEEIRFARREAALGEDTAQGDYAPPLEATPHRQVHVERSSIDDEVARAEREAYQMDAARSRDVRYPRTDTELRDEMGIKQSPRDELR
jgi:hypothetical protein